MSRRTNLHGNPQAFWVRMCALTRTRQGFTVPEIHAGYTGGRYQRVRAYVLACAKAGVIEADGTRTTAEGRKATLYRVKVTGARDPIARACALPAQPGSVQEQIWVAMRGLGPFEERELAVQASTDDVAVNLAAVRKYAKALLAAGYLQQLPKRGSGGRRVLRLAPTHNTGPHPPAVLANGVVFDRNRNAVLGQGGAV